MLLFECFGCKFVFMCVGMLVWVWCCDVFVGLDELCVVLYSGEMECVLFKLVSGFSFGCYVLMLVLLILLFEFDVLFFDDVCLEFVFGSDEEVFSYVEFGCVDFGFVYMLCILCLFEYYVVYIEEFVLVCSVGVLCEYVVLCMLVDCVVLFFVIYDELDVVYGLWFKVLFWCMFEMIVSVYYVFDLEEVSILVEVGMGWLVLLLYVI